jgi:hypothetical protein
MTKYIIKKEKKPPQKTKITADSHVFIPFLLTKLCKITARMSIERFEPCYEPQNKKNNLSI